MQYAEVRGQFGRFWSLWPLYEFRDLNTASKRSNRYLDRVRQWGGQHLFLNDDIFICLQVRLLKCILLNIHWWKLWFYHFYTLFPTHQFSFSFSVFLSLSEYQLSPFIAVWMYKNMVWSTRVLIASWGLHFWRKLILPPEHPSNTSSPSQRVRMPWTHPPCLGILIGLVLCKSYESVSATVQTEVFNYRPREII